MKRRNLKTNIITSIVGPRTLWSTWQRMPQLDRSRSKAWTIYNDWLTFPRSGVRIWNKIPHTLREQRKDPFKPKLHKLLIKILETKKVYVDMSTITSSYLNSLFSLSVFLPYNYRCYFLFIYLFIYLLHFFLLSLFLRSFADFIKDNYCIVAHLE